MTYKQNEYFEIIEPDVHDGAVDSLDVSVDGHLEIGLRKVDGSKIRLHVSGLKRMRCNDFREGNIISSIYVFHRTIPPSEYIQLLLDLESKETTEYSQNIIDLIQQGELTLFSIIPSYGCELHALCASVEVKYLS